MQEIEVKFLNIDKEALEKKLLGIGAEKVGDMFLRHVAFDFPGWPLNKDNSWVRVRDEGDKVTLTYKKRLGVTSQDGSTKDAGMEEVELEVSSYELIKSFLKKIGMVEKHGEAQKKRSKWKRGDVEFDIDTIALIPPYLEIEAKSWEDIDRVIIELGLDPKEKKICSSQQIYMMYGINVEEYETINFEEVIKK